MKTECELILINDINFNEGDILKFDIYTTRNNNNILLKLNGNPLTNEDLLRIEKFKEIYIKIIDLNLYKELIEEITKNEFIENSKKIYLNTANALNNILHNPEKLSNIDQANEIVNHLTDIVLNENFTIKSILEIMSHDYYTHTHSINVSIYALSFGLFLKLNEKDLKKLGISALLHDLGKSKIDFNIINKVGKLDENEFLEMKKHPEIGDFLAKNIGIEDKDILSGIRNHHEKINGNGYPDKLKGNEISLFAKIIGISDIFDALTTKRSYKEEMSTFDSLI